MAGKKGDKTKKSNAEPMTYESSIAPNTRDQMARDAYLARKEADGTKQTTDKKES